MIMLWEKTECLKLRMTCLKDFDTKYCYYCIFNFVLYTILISNYKGIKNVRQKIQYC
jgi:hypothetical protein